MGYKPIVDFIGNMYSTIKERIGNSEKSGLIGDSVLTAEKYDWVKIGIFIFKSSQRIYNSTCPRIWLKFKTAMAFKLKNRMMENVAHKLLIISIVRWIVYVCIT